MLHLASRTSDVWLDRARAQLDEVLLDHAHCEKKAAGAAIKLLFSYPHHGFLQDPLAELAQEELDHFRRVLVRLEARGVDFRAMRPGPYGAALHGLLRATEPERLSDLLLISALIEARSCERFQLLADAVDEPELAAFYRELVASEARHHGLYLELARELVPGPMLEQRLVELAAWEAEIVARRCPVVRMHAG